MVEGQLDAIRCWTAGLHTAVALKAVAITENNSDCSEDMNPHRLSAYWTATRLGEKPRFVPFPRLQVLALSSVSFCCLKMRIRMI